MLLFFADTPGELAMNEVVDKAEKPVTFGTYEFDLKTNKVTHSSGSSKVLSPDLSTMLRMLAYKKGVHVKKEDMFEALCEGKAAKPEPKIVDVQICMLRSELKKLSDEEYAGSHIVTEWGVGYVLSDEPKPLKKFSKRKLLWKRGLNERMADIHLRVE